MTDNTEMNREQRGVNPRQDIEIIGLGSRTTDKGALLLDAAHKPVKRFLELSADKDWRSVGITYKLSDGAPVRILIHEGARRKDVIFMLSHLQTMLSGHWDDLVGEDWYETHDDWSAIEEGHPF